MTVNNILTTDEVEAFVEAVNDVRCCNIEAEYDVIDAYGTLAQFISNFGQPVESDIADNGLTVHYWRAVQAQKGDQRKDVALVEFSGERIAITHAA